MSRCAVPAYEYIQACLLHLIDVEWQPYDLSFVEEVNLPALYLGIAKGLTIKCPLVKVQNPEHNDQNHSTCISRKNQSHCLLQYFSYIRVS